MRRALLSTLILGAMAGCSNSSETSEAYELTAFEAAGVQPDSDQPLVPDARHVLPNVLYNCGIASHQPVDATDSAIVLRFEIEAGNVDQLACVRDAMPAGATLEEAIFS